ncbi:MAG TPA: hypothetical protein VHG28_04030 [Longimicrobiaceae bacterium]|nr:hypothetical protein [Longimicrobiaceae bacterium]
MRKLAYTLAAAAALLALPRAGEAQDYRQTVVAQLEAASQPVVRQGFAADASVFNRDVQIGALAQGATSMVELNLTAGARYFIAAACDEDCSDLDLRIFPADNATALAEDTGEDDYPMVTFTAPTTGRYMLAVDMAKCTGSVCYYGYRVFRK